jgi:hypothetical protein
MEKINEKNENSKHGPKIYKKPFVLMMPPVESGGCSIAMIGSGRSGKTTALKHIIDTYMNKHCGVIFSQSAKATAYNQMKYPLLPLSSVYIPELVNCAYKINRENKNSYPFLFVLDDCPLVKNDKELLKTLTIYRNQSISAIHCVQSPTLINPTCRSNYTFIMLFKQNSTEQIEQSIKMFLRGYFPSTWNYEKKIQWYKENTADHKFIFIDNWNATIQICKIDLE